MENPAANNETTAVDLLEHWVEDDQIADQIRKTFAAAHEGRRALVVMDARIDEVELFERLLVEDDDIQMRVLLRMTGTQHLTLGGEDGVFAILTPEDQTATVKVIELTSTREDEAHVIEVGGRRAFPLALTEEEVLDEDSLQTESLEGYKSEFLIDDPNHKFKQDDRKDKPSLHLFHVESALVHLRFIDATINRLHSFSNIHMLHLVGVLSKEREELVREYASFAQAEKMLASLNLTAGISLVDSDGRSPEGPMD